MRAFPCSTAPVPLECLIAVSTSGREVVASAPENVRVEQITIRVEVGRLKKGASHLFDDFFCCRDGRSHVFSDHSNRIVGRATYVASMPTPKPLRSDVLERSPVTSGESMLLGRIEIGWTTAGVDDAPFVHAASVSRQFCCSRRLPSRCRARRRPRRQRVVGRCITATRRVRATSPH